MNTTVTHNNDLKAARAFDSQAIIFDKLYGNDTIIKYKRERVRRHMEKYLPAEASILELNAGTGEDAIYFASKGYHVHATDISGNMLKVLAEKTKNLRLTGKISYEQCSFTELENLTNPGPYDHIFSNFAGLNCTDNLEKVLDSFFYLLKPGGMVTLVMLPEFCLWETTLLFRGKWKTAFRRFAGKKGAAAKVEGNSFRCWYYNPSVIENHLKALFEKVALEGLCTFVPPSYIMGFAEKHPRLYQRLQKLEEKFMHKWPWRNIGDYFILTIRKC